MTTSDIIRIAATVAVAQLVCDWLANRFFFSREPYQHSLSNLERAQSKLRRAKNEGADDADQVPGKGASNKEKQKKKLQQAEDDSKQAAADIAQKHTVPALFISIFFLMLLRIFGTEYAGRPIAILPFMPISLLRRVTGRGLDLSLASSTSTLPPMNPILELEAMAVSSGNKVTDVSQACSFLVIYILASLSIKYYVHKIFGTEPPPGADEGFSTIMDSPQVHQMAKGFGLDPDQTVDTKPKQGKKSKKSK